MEVMGLMLGEFVDDYTVKVVDVFAMPQVRISRCCLSWQGPHALCSPPPPRRASLAQSGTGVSVEAVDPVFQTKMLDMLKQTGRCVARLTRGRGFSGSLSKPRHTPSHRPAPLHSPLLSRLSPPYVSQAGDGGWVVP
jgi:hypothetical protein